jgi:hypothetical protein
VDGVIAVFEDVETVDDFESVSWTFEVAKPLVTEGSLVKCAPGPVSSLGSGAFNGSRRYFCA